MDFVDDELDQVNMGIAIVTPVQDLMVVLHGEELTRMRKKGDGEYEREYKKTPPRTEPSETDEEKK